MCTGALVLARIDRVVFAAKDPKTGACGSVLNVSQHPTLNHRFIVESGLYEEESSQLITDFFRRKRAVDL